MAFYTALSTDIKDFENVFRLSPAWHSAIGAMWRVKYEITLASHDKNISRR